jgi:catechol 2,3-dioxygenase-like lactoylglutathione lyase family enzyme
VLRLGHLNITVTDVDRSTAFYARWFGFDRILADYPDGTRFVTDGSGFELALHHRAGAGPQGGDWHFGFLAADPGTVRSLLTQLRSDAVAVMEVEDEPGYVGFKCEDPDGHVIEVYWENRT